MRPALKIAIFLLCAVLVHVLLLKGHRTVMQDSRLMVVNRKMQSIEESPKTLIMGNSHAVAIDEGVIGNALNIAGYGEHIHQSWYKLKFLLDEGKKPDRIILSCDLGMLRSLNPDDLPYQWYWNKFEDAELGNFAHSRRHFLMNRLLARAFPYTETETDAMDYYFGSAKKEGQLRESGSDKLHEQTHTDSCLQAQFSEYGLYFLDRFLERCRAENIEVHLTRFPITTGFIQQQASCYRSEDYYSTLRVIAAKPDLDLNWIDLHNSFPNEDFRDPHHLRTGSPRSRLSKMIADSLAAFPME